MKEVSLTPMDKLMDTESEMDSLPHLKPGVFVVVRSGPSKGLRGLVTGRTDSGRIILQVDALGNTTSLRLDPAVLDVVE